MTTGLQASAQEELRNIVSKIENLEIEKAALSADISEILRDAKNKGFDTKVLREVIRLRKKSESEREEAETILSVYLSALGMLPVQGDLLDAAEHEAPQLVS